MPKTQIKVLDGQVMICNPVVVNYRGPELDRSPLAFKVNNLIHAVRRRMEHCMEKLQEAQANNQITEIYNYEDVGTQICFADGYGFQATSYAAMETLMAKLVANKGLELNTHQLYELLDVREVDQLFKAWIQAGHGWTKYTAMLDCLRHDIQVKERI